MKGLTFSHRLCQNVFEVMKMETIRHTCLDGGYYRRHYIWCGRYLPVDYGHCFHPPRIRYCRPGMAACPKWLPRTEAYRNTYLPPE